MKSSKIWIRAVTLVTMVITISLFLSLFKGITLYNLNFGPLSIGKLFFKLHNRIVLKITDLNLTPTSSAATPSGGPVNFKLSYLQGVNLIEELEVQNFSAPGVEGNFSYRNREFQIETNLVRGEGFLEIKPEGVSLQLEGVQLKLPQLPLTIGSSYLEVEGNSLATGLQVSGFLTIGGGVLYFQGRVTSTGLQLGVTGGLGELKLPIATLSNWERLDGEFSIPFTGGGPEGVLKLGKGGVNLPGVGLSVKVEGLSLQLSPPAVEGNLTAGEVEGREFKLRRGWLEGATFKYLLDRGWGEVQLGKVGFKTLPIAGYRLSGLLSNLRASGGVAGEVDGEFQKFKLEARGRVPLSLLLSGGGVSGNWITKNFTGAIYRALLRQQQNWVKIGAITFGYTPGESYLYTHWIALGNPEGNGSILNLALEQRGRLLGYSLRNGLFQLKNLPFQIQVPLLYGTEKRVEVPKIGLEGWGLPGEGRGLVVDIPKKRAILKELEFSGVQISPLEVNLTKKAIFISFESNTTLNRQVQRLLKEGLGVELPIVEKRGENRIKGVAEIPLQQPTPQFQVKGEILNALFQLTTLPLQLERALIQVTPTGVQFRTQNLKLQLPGGEVGFSGVGGVNFPEQFLQFDGNLSLRYLPFISLSNFEEEGELNLTTLHLQLARLGIGGDLKKGLISIPLNPLLHYTPFTPAVAGGEVNLSYQGPLKVGGEVKLTAPLLPKNPDPSLLQFQLEIGDQIQLQFPFGEVKVAPATHQLQFQLTGEEFNLTPLPKIAEKLQQKLAQFQPPSHQNPQKEGNTSSNSPAPLPWILHGHLSNLKLDYSNFQIPIGEFNLSLKGPAQLVEGQFQNLGIHRQNLHLQLKEGNFSYRLDRQELLSAHLSSPPLKVKIWQHNGYTIATGSKIDLGWFERTTGLKGIFAQLNLAGSGVITPDKFILVNIRIWDTIIAKLRLLNNIIALINTIPAILSFQPAGFSGKGYKIKEGRFTIVADRQFQTIHLTKGAIIGKNQNLNLFFWGYIYPAQKSLDLMVRVVIPIKVKYIPLVGPLVSYILFGKSGGIVVDAKATGNWEDPKVELSTVRDLTSAPLKILYRLLSTPFQLQDIYNGVYNGGDLEGEEGE